MVGLADKYPEKLCGDAPTILQALNEAKTENKIMAANGSWYRVLKEGEEIVKTADFEFLTVDKKAKPIQFNLHWDGKDWKVDSKDITDEMEGTMEEEALILEKAEKVMKDEATALQVAESKLAPLRKKSPHLRIDMISFNFMDPAYSNEEIVPCWRVTAKNWPIISYLKSKEKSRSAEVVIDARDGKVLSFSSE